MELRAERGRAVLVGAPELFEPPTALAGALDEWAEVAHAVCADGAVDPTTAELVSARGRQLAARLATAAGTTVGYADPVLGTTEPVPPTTDHPVDRSWSFDANANGDVTGPSGMPVLHDLLAHRPLPGQPAQPHGSPRPDQPHGSPHPDQRPSGWSAAWADAPAGPTPWATGLTVSAFAAVVVLAAVVTLVRGLAEVTWLLGAMGLIVVTGGLAPSIWLARHTPLWRWVGLGVATGITISWIAVILATLGPGTPQP